MTLGFLTHPGHTDRPHARNSTPLNATTSTETSAATETSGQGKRKGFGAAVKVEASQATQRAEIAKKARYNV